MMQVGCDGVKWKYNIQSPSLVFFQSQISSHTSLLEEKQKPKNLTAGFQLQHISINVTHGGPKIRVGNCGESKALKTPTSLLRFHAIWAPLFGRNKTKTKGPHYVFSNDI